MHCQQNIKMYATKRLNEIRNYVLLNSYTYSILQLHLQHLTATPTASYSYTYSILQNISGNFVVPEKNVKKADRVPLNETVL